MHPTRVSLFFITLLFLAPLCAAATPRAPGAVVLDVSSWTQTTLPSGRLQYQWNANLSWSLSPDDPDQTNGSLDYTVYQNVSVNATGLASCTATANYFCTGWLPIFNSTPTAGTCSRGWACISLSYVGNTPSLGDLFNGTMGTYNVTARSAQNERSLGSCIVNVDTLNTTNASPSGHDQCGYPQIRAPSGASALVTLVGNASVASQIDVRANLSADDPNSTQGNLSYRILLYTQDYDVNSSGADLGLDPRTAADQNGVRLNTLTIGGSSPGVVFVQWRAEDPLTHQWSNLSCSVSVNTANPGASSACGVLGDATNTTQGSPTFPMFDVTTFANNSGISLTLASWLLIGVLAAFFIFIAFALAGAEGAVAVGATVLPFAYVLNLLPLWALVLLFVLAAISLVATWGRRE